MEKKGGYQVLLLAEELLAIDICWERGDKFSLKAVW